MTYLTRRWPILLLVLLLALIGGAVWWFLHRGKQHLETDMRAWVIEQSRGEIVPTKVEGTIGGTLTLWDTTLYVVDDVPAPLAIATIAKTTGAIDWELYKRTSKAWPKSASIEGFELTLKLDDNNDLLFPAFDFDDDPGYETPKDPSSIPSDPKAWPEQRYGARTVAITLTDGTVHYHLPELETQGLPPLTISEVDITGSYQDKQELKIDSFSGQYLGAPLLASGSLWYRRDRPYDLAVTFGPMALMELLAQFGEAPEAGLVEGLVSLDGRITGQRGGNTIAGTLTAGTMRFKGLEIGNVSLPFELKDRILAFDNGRIEAFGGSIMVDGIHRGKRALADEPASELHLRIEQVQLADYFAALNQPTFRLMAPVVGTADLIFDSQRHLTAVAELESGHFDVAGIHCANLEANLTYADGAVEVTNTRFKPESGGFVHLTASAKDVRAWGKTPAQMALTAEGIRLGPILEELDLPSYGCDGTMDGSATYLLRSETDWNAEVELRSTKGKILSPFAPGFEEAVKAKGAKKGTTMPYSLLHIEGSLKPNHITLKDLTLRSPDFRLDTSGTLRTPTPINLAGTINARKSEAKKMDKVKKYVQYLPDDKDGFVRFKFNLSGPMNDPIFDPLIKANASAGLKDRIKDIF